MDWVPEHKTANVKLVSRILEVLLKKKNFFHWHGGWEAGGMKIITGGWNTSPCSAVAKLIIKFFLTMLWMTNYISNELFVLGEKMENRMIVAGFGWHSPSLATYYKVSSERNCHFASINERDNNRIYEFLNL